MKHRIPPEVFRPMSFVVLTVVAICTAVLLTLGNGAAAQDSGRPLQVSEVVAALRSAGLPVNDLERQQVRSSPSSSPATEREAFGFSVPRLAPSGGRIMIFDSTDEMNRKAVWFRRSGASAVIHHNVLLWLDPAMPKQDAVRYEQALKGIR